MTTFGGRRSCTDRVDPAAGQVGERREVLGPGLHRGYEAAHGARRGCATFYGPPADELAHHRISAQQVGVVDVLVAGEAREDRLAQQPGEAVPAVTSGARITDQPRRRIGQPEGVVQFAMQEQTVVGADRGAAERQLDRAVELEPQRAGLSFTRRVHRRHTCPPWLSLCGGETIRLRNLTKAASIWGMRVQVGPLRSYMIFEWRLQHRSDCGAGCPKDLGWQKPYGARAALGAMLVDATGPGGAQALPGSSRRSAFPID